MGDKQEHSHKHLEHGPHGRGHEGHEHHGLVEVTLLLEDEHLDALDEAAAELTRAARLLAAGLVAPGSDHVIKCSHAFNMLEARGAISVTERTGYIARVRKLARLAAVA